MCGIVKSAPVVVPRQTTLLNSLSSHFGSFGIWESHWSTGEMSMSECREVDVETKSGYKMPGRGPGLLDAVGQ